MSAAATAAGYLYASGRLRGRSAREQDHNNAREQDHNNEQRPEEKQAAQPREEIRVAVLPQQDEKPRRTPKIEYRTRRRWSAA